MSSSSQLDSLASTASQRVTAQRIYLLIVTGTLAEAVEFANRRFPGAEHVILNRRQLRENGLLGQISAFRQLQGHAVIFFMSSMAELQEPSLALLSAFLHSCPVTLLADSHGEVKEYGTFSRIGLLPILLLNALSDALTFGLAWLLLKTFSLFVRSPARLDPQHVHGGEMEITYIYPYPLDTAVAGGAMSHTTGFLSGLARLGIKCEIFAGRAFPSSGFALRIVPSKRVWFLFRESLMLSYNLRFIAAVRKALKGRRPGAFYQRNGRFVVAGAFLACLFRTGFILEYNGPELRMADYGDPIRFRGLLRLCENISLAQASLIVVVSDALRDELLERGISPRRILVNSNAADTEIFYPDCGGQQLRERLGFDGSEIVVAFVGTFSYWHGVSILLKAIQILVKQGIENPDAVEVRFLLVGDGPLCAEIRQELERESPATVLFTGIIRHDLVPAYLDAADILLSPHVPMPDGRPFFGSPTKLFEYMAMGKAIVASDLDQLSQVLKHGTTAWMVEPGNAAELAEAILMLVRNPELRTRLGKNARAAAQSEHSWHHNAARLVARANQVANEELVARASTQFTDN